MQDSISTPMPHRIIAFYDCIIVGVVSAASLVMGELLTIETSAGEVSELRSLLIPLLGAIIATGGMIMFQIEKEPRNVVLGRALFALLFGSGFMQALTVFFPSLTEKMNRPVVMLISGAVMSMFFYVVAYFIARGLFRRGSKIADVMLDEAQRRAGILVNPDTTIRQMKTDSFVAGARAQDKESQGKEP